jgi:hypothetical protein
MDGKYISVLNSMESRLLAAHRGHPPATRDDTHLCKLNHWSRRDRRWQPGMMHTLVQLNLWSRRDRRRKPGTTRRESWVGPDG